MDADGKKEKQRAALLGQGVGYYIDKPQAVRFYPPTLTGLSRPRPFDISRIDPRAAAGHRQGRGGRCRSEGPADHALGRFTAGPGAVGRR